MTRNVSPKLVKKSELQVKTTTFIFFFLIFFPLYRRILRDHSFNMYAKISEKPTFLTP